MRYRRTDMEGGTYFFTVNLADRKETLLTSYIHSLRTIIIKVKQAHPFHIDAMVILPDHLHVIWTLPKGDADYPVRWSLIKAGFSRCVPKTESRRQSRINKGERGIWQRRYWEHLVRDERDFEMHVNYIHYNPVKHGYVEKASDWEYSSIHRYIEQGDIPADWGSKNLNTEEGFGERKKLL